MSNKLGNENGDKLKERSQLSLWATNSAIWDWDVENKRFWSSAGNQILCGHPAEEVEEPFDIDDVTNPWLLRLHPDDRVRVTQSVHDHLENDTPFDVEYRYRKSDGEYVWIHSLGRAIRDPQGRPLRMAGSNADISHRKRAEIEAQWFREAMDNASEGIVIYDESERFVYANKRYRELVPAIAHLLKPGTHREEVRKTLLSSGTLSTDADTAEQFIDEMRRSQSVGGTAELQFANGLWLKRSDYVLP